MPPVANPMRRVLIIGGGLAGPCLALSLAKHNIPSIIFELRPHRTDQGGSITLTPNGLQVLDRYAGVYDRIRAEGYTYMRMGAWSEQGEKFGDIVVGDEKTGYPAVRIMRTSLANILLDAAEASGLIEVQHGVKLSRIEETDSGVTAIFQDGSRYDGDILVGADGIRSQVREHVLGDESPVPAYAGICVVNGFLPASAIAKPDPSITFPSFLFTSAGMLLVVPINSTGDTIAWGINAEMEDRDRAGWRELQDSGEAFRVAKSSYDDVQVEPIRSILDHAKASESRLWATYSIPKLPKWHTARVCLIGDAAHGMPPNGQGTGLAFEDGAILARLITSSLPAALNKDYAALFERFQALRDPRIDAVREKSKTVGQAKHRTPEWLWSLKKWGMRAYFWWNNYQLMHINESRYDVGALDLGA